MWRNGYYYRQRWQHGTCTTEYIGAGPVAELIAQLDAIERQQRQEERQAWLAIVAEQDAIDTEIDNVGAALGAVVEAALLLAGYHVTPNRRWRKQRGE